MKTEINTNRTFFGITAFYLFLLTFFIFIYGLIFDYSYITYIPKEFNWLQISIFVLYGFSFLIFLYSKVKDNLKLLKTSILFLFVFAWLFSIYFFEMGQISSDDTLMFNTPFFIKNIFDIYYLGVTNILSLFYSLFCLRYLLLISNKSNYVCNNVPLLLLFLLGLFTKIVVLIISLLVYRNLEIFNGVITDSLLLTLINSFLQTRLESLYSLVAFIYGLSIIINLIKLKFSKKKHNNYDEENIDEAEVDEDYNDIFDK